MLTGSCDDAVYKCKIIFALIRFYKFPICRNEDGVDSAILHLFNAFLMSAGLVAAELLNSPARRSIGLSLTTSWVAEPCFCSFTLACMLMQHNNARKDNTILFINLHFRKGLEILETGIAPFLCILQLYIEQRVCMLPFLLMSLHILLG